MAKEKINIMLVDDEVHFLESMTKRLAFRDFNVIAVDRGEKAIEIAREHPLDIAIVDLKMPGLDGEETLQALKKEHRFLEIVILTGHGSFDSALLLNEKGVYFYMEKPCTLQALLEVIVQAYCRKLIRSQCADKQTVDAVLAQAQGISSTDLLEKLRELDHE